MNILSVLTTINNNLVSSSYHGDLLVLSVMVSLIAIYGFILRKHQILINLLAIYIAMLGVSLFFSTRLTGRLETIIKLEQAYIVILLFALIWLAVILILSFSYLIKKVNYNYSFVGRWGRALISSIIHTGLVFSFIISYGPDKWAVYFSAWQLKLFNSPISLMVWFILSLCGLLIIRIKRRGPGRPSL